MGGSKESSGNRQAGGKGRFHFIWKVAWKMEVIKEVCRQGLKMRWEWRFQALSEVTDG